MNDNDKKKICIMCGNESENGIMIMENFICDKCERNIVKEEISSKDYEYFKEQIKERIGEKIKNYTGVNK